jgi:MoxR-like ATPase
MTKVLFGLEPQEQRTYLAVEAGEAVLLYGPAGSGKTILAQQLADKYAESVKKRTGQDIPVIYLQLYPEMTKGTLIGGETLRNGSIVVEPQVITRLGAQGAVFIIDECTHTTEPVLLAFNSLIEEPNLTVIGDKVFNMHKDTRFIFSGNWPDHTGNISLPTSFANRVYIEEINYPDEESYVKLAVHYTNVHADIAKFVALLINKVRDDTLPLSPRNMLACTRAAKRLHKSGFKALPSSVRTTSDTRKFFLVLKELDIDPEMFKAVVLSTLSVYVKTHSATPDKIKALLW